jgi:molecular chaperone GrpE
MNGQTERNDDDSEQPSGQSPDAPRSDAEEAVQAALDAAADAEAADSDPRSELQAKADEHWNKYLRAVAELDNVRKRAARDVDNARKFALERFSGDLLAVRDSLEMGLAAGDNADAADLRSGGEATLKLLATTMERYGVEEIDPQGEPFDPQFHEAMTMQPSRDVEPGTVLTVFQKGYVLNGRLLRPARVVVAQEPQDQAE